MQRESRRSTTMGLTRNHRIVILSFVACVLLMFLLVRHNPFSSQTPMRFRRAATTLVMVPGHGMFLKDHWSVAGWLEKFIPDINEQIRTALMEYDPSDSVVMFSGGQTRADVGRISEGETYIAAAKYLGVPNYRRAVAEEYARDSYENVLFSLCRFRELTGKYPERYVVVGFEFKRERFVQEHRRAIRFPEQFFEYRGVPIRDPESIREQVQMERAGTIPQFRKDPYGCSPPLSTKKIERDPFERSHPYEKSCPELRDLFRACGSAIYDGPLPWVET